MYTNRVQAPVEKIGLTGFDKPLKEFKKLSQDHIAEEKAKTAQLASETNKQKEEQAAKLTRSRKDAEAERERQEKASKEQREKYLSMSEKVDAPDRANMYDGDFAMLEDVAVYLSDPEVIKDYSSSVEGEMELNSLIDQLLTLTDTFETYYKETYGDKSDEMDSRTFHGSLNRDLNGVSSIGDLNYDTPHLEMMAKLQQLDSRRHTDMRIEGGRVVFTGENGDEIVPGEDLDMDVFTPEISERAPVTGADFLNRGFDGEAFVSEQDVIDYVEDGLGIASVQRDAARAYEEKMKSTNPDFNYTPEEILATPKLRMAAFEGFQKTAVERWNEKTKEEEPKAPKKEEPKAPKKEEQTPDRGEDPRLSGPAPTSGLEDVNIAGAPEVTLQQQRAQVDTVQDAIGRALTPEEIETLSDPDMQAILRVAGVNAPLILEGNAAQEVAGMEIGNYEDPIQEEVMVKPTPEFRSITIDPSQDIGRPSSGLEDVNLQQRTPSLLERLGISRKKNEERNQGMADEFGNKFSGELQDALSYNPEAAKREQEKAREEFESQFTDQEKPLFLEGDYGNTRSTSQIGGQNISYRNFERNKGPEIEATIQTDEEGSVQAPTRISQMSFDTDRFGWEIQTATGDTFFLPFDGDSIEDTDIGVRDQSTGEPVTLLQTITKGFEKMYGEGSLMKFLGYLQSKAFSGIDN
jgi:hypothetical protein